MRKSETKSFKTSDGEIKITVTQLGGLEAGRLLPEVVKKVLPLINAKKLDDVKFDQVTELLDADQLEAMLLKLLKGAQYQVNGQISDLTRDVLDEMFAGQVNELINLGRFAFMVNFGNFFKGASGAAVKK